MQIDFSGNQIRQKPNSFITRHSIYKYNYEQFTFCRLIPTFEGFDFTDPF